MKVISLVIDNAKSFRERTTIFFKDGINILIGPNGGGKSNTLDILVHILRERFFIALNLVPIQVNGQWYYRVQEEAGMNQIDKFNDSNDKQEFEMEFELSNKDIDNINYLGEAITF